MEVHEKGDAPRQSHSELQIVTAMSVPPLKVTEPRRVRKVLVGDEHTNAIHGCCQMVLCYENLKEDDHGWYMAGWMVESLARVLLDHPLLAGRLQRKDGTGFEIVANDSGIRLLEACYPTSLSHFLELNERNKHLMTELVFWKEIDAECPQFSPLCYVQANFTLHYIITLHACSICFYLVLVGFQWIETVCLFTFRLQILNVEGTVLALVAACYWQMFLWWIIFSGNGLKYTRTCQTNVEKLRHPYFTTHPRKSRSLFH